MKIIRTSLAILFCLLIASCSGALVRNNTPTGGFKIIDGPRGTPTTLYLSWEIHQIGQGKIGQDNKFQLQMTYDAERAEKFGITKIDSERQGGGILSKSGIKFLPLYSSHYVLLKGGTESDRHYSAIYLSAEQFQNEVARWHKALKGRDPTKGVEIAEFEVISP